MALRIRLLGGLALEGVDFAQLGSRKARTLLARLAVGRGATIGADVLIELLWPTAQERPARANDQLSVLISRLRAVVEPARLPRLGGGYALRVDWLDIDAQAGLLAEARKRLSAGGLAPARVAIDAAIALDRGPLLPDEPGGDWLDGERAAAARVAHDVLVAAAEIALAAGDAWYAADSAWTALSAEPYDEAALRLLMRALAESGRPAQGLTAYVEFAERLRDELGVDPAPQTTQSYLDLLHAKPSTPVRPAVARELPGRAADLQTLDTAFRKASMDAAVLVRVSGEAGIGKTRLLDTWAAGWTGPGHLLRATGSEMGGGLPLQPLLDALAVHLPRWPSVDPGILAPFLGEPGADQAQMLTIFAGPGSGQGLLVAALDTLVTQLAGDGPVVIVVDDGQWLDRATLSWLWHVPQRLASVPLLIVVAHRPGEGATPPGTVGIALGPLDRAAVAEVVGEQRATELHSRSGGHPLFLVELANATGDELPESIRDSVAERCDRAGAAAATLRAAAVLGPEADLDLLASVLDTPAATLLDHLEEGVRRGLMVEHGTGFRFRHQLIRESLCLVTGAGRTALLHRQAARSLRLRNGASPWDVAYHARLGGDLTQAALSLADAGELAARRFEHDEALRFFDEALSIQDDPALRLRRARVALPAGRFADAAADAGAAMAGGAGAEGMEVASIAAYLLRDFPRCRRLAEDGARLSDDPVLRTSCLTLAGRVSHVDGDLEAAERLLTEALQSAPPTMRPLAQIWAAPLRIDRGDPAGALELLSDPLPGQPQRHPFLAPHRHLAAGQALGLLGRVEEAMAELALADEAAESQRTSRFAARVDNCRAWILRGMDEHDLADARHECAYRASVGAAGMTEPVVDALLGLAEGRLIAGDATEAADLLHRAAAELEKPHPFRWRHWLQYRLLQARCGVSADASSVASDVLEEAQRLGVSQIEDLARRLVR